MIDEKEVERFSKYGHSAKYLAEYVHSAKHLAEYVHSASLFARQENRSTAEAKIRLCLCLKTALDIVPCLAEMLRPARSVLIRSFRQVSGIAHVLALRLLECTSVQQEGQSLE